jgi:hypothetical protein
VIFLRRGLIRLADDNRLSWDYRDGMHLRLSDKRQRDWIVAAVLAAVSLLQVSLTPGPRASKPSPPCSPSPPARPSRSASATRPRPA